MSKETLSRCFGSAHVPGNEALYILCKYTRLHHRYQTPPSISPPSGGNLQELELSLAAQVKRSNNLLESLLEKRESPQAALKPQV